MVGLSLLVLRSSSPGTGFSVGDAVIQSASCVNPECGGLVAYLRSRLGQEGLEEALQRESAEMSGPHDQRAIGPSGSTCTTYSTHVVAGENQLAGPPITMPLFGESSGGEEAG